MSLTMYTLDSFRIRMFSLQAIQWTYLSKNGGIVVETLMTQGVECGLEDAKSFKSAFKVKSGYWRLLDY